MTQRNLVAAPPIRTVFLDRDGVINRKRPGDGYVETWEQFEFLPGSIAGLRILHRAGVRLIVVTNQQGVALGLVPMPELERIHQRMTEILARSGVKVDAVLVCPHAEGTCSCRKPALGLFEVAKERFPDVEFSRSAVIGDSWRDMKAARVLGSLALLVGSPRTADLRETTEIDGYAPSLLEVIRRFVVPEIRSSGTNR